MMLQIDQIKGTMDIIVPMLQQAVGPGELTREAVEALNPPDRRVAQAKEIFLQMEANGITKELVDELDADVTHRLDYGLNPSFDPRDIVGDDPTDGTERIYGNADVLGPDAYHVSDVAVIIAALGLMTLPINLAGYRERGILRRLHASSVPAEVVVAAQLTLALATFAVAPW